MRWRRSLGTAYLGAVPWFCVKVVQIKHNRSVTKPNTISFTTTWYSMSSKQDKHWCLTVIKSVFFFSLFILTELTMGPQTSLNLLFFFISKTYCGFLFCRKQHQNTECIDHWCTKPLVNSWNNLDRKPSSTQSIYGTIGVHSYRFLPVPTTFLQWQSLSPPLLPTEKISLDTLIR